MKSASGTREKTPRGQKDEFDRAFDRIEAEMPDRVTRAIRWLRDPKARPVRLPLGIACIVASAFWFLPIVGLEFLPIGLLLVAQDIPFLRRPVGRMILWLERKWIALRHWWRDKRSPVT